MAIYPKDYQLNQFKEDCLKETKFGDVLIEFQIKFNNIKDLKKLLMNDIENPKINYIYFLISWIYL